MDEGRAMEKMTGPPLDLFARRDLAHRPGPERTGDPVEGEGLAGGAGQARTKSGQKRPGRARGWRIPGAEL